MIPGYPQEYRRQPDAIDDFRSFRASVYAEARKLPGYPFIPCPICDGTPLMGCNHTIPERARAAHPDF